jgi:hypothetical protein
MPVPIVRKKPQHRVPGLGGVGDLGGTNAQTMLSDCDAGMKSIPRRIGESSARSVLGH